MHQLFRAKLISPFFSYNQNSIYFFEKNKIIKLQFQLYPYGYTPYLNFKLSFDERKKVLLPVSCNHRLSKVHLRFESL
jgi:hypothetical protein